MIPERIDIFMKVMLALVGIFLLFILLRIILKRKYRNKRQANAVYIDANAVLLGIELSGPCIKQQTAAILQMQVKPNAGRNFIAELKTVFNEAELPGIKTGSIIKVRYNAADPKDILMIKET